MPIIFFSGAGITKKMTKFKYDFTKKKYIKNDFIDKLNKLDKLIIPDLKYKHIYYYMNQNSSKKFYNPIKNLTLENININKTIQNLKFDKRQKYIVIGHSDGIYFAMEFAKQYPKLIKEIISLDGSWISEKLCKQRLLNWKNKNKIIKPIKTQKELNNIMEEIIKNKDNNSIQKIINYKRYEHTKECIKSKYQNIIKKHKFTIFRDFNSKINNDIDKQFNEYSIIENNIMLKLSDNYQIFWQIDAGHGLWFNKMYKKQILNYIKCLI